MAQPIEIPTGGLAGRVALVTGGARGIGEAIARRLAQAGAEIVIADIDGAEAEDAAKAIAANIGPATACPVDIGDDAAVRRLADYVGQRHGKCEILVNNAGILDMNGVDTLSIERFNEVCNINLTGYLRATQAMLPLIRKAATGRRIINIASIMGLRGAPESLAYSTAKGAIVNMTRALASDLAPDGILVNAIAPGFIDTRMAVLPGDLGHEHESDWFKDIYIKYGRIPLRRAGQPQDIAGPAFFLASDDSAYVTGQVMLVDGGVSSTF